MCQEVVLVRPRSRSVLFLTFLRLIKRGVFGHEDVLQPYKVPIWDYWKWVHESNRSFFSTFSIFILKVCPFILFSRKIDGFLKTQIPSSTPHGSTRSLNQDCRHLSIISQEAPSSRTGSNPFSSNIKLSVRQSDINPQPTPYLKIVQKRSWPARYY